MKIKDYVYQTEGALLSLLKFKIRFSVTNNAYLLNDRWVNEIDEHYFTDKAEKVQQLLNKQLKYGLNHVEFLSKLEARIQKRLESVKKYLKITPEIIKEFAEIVDPPIKHKVIPYSNSDWYEQFKEGNGIEATLGNDRLIYLNFNSGKLNGYDTPIDFEYGLLSYAIQKYYEAVSNLHSYIFSLIENARYIDFKSLVIEDRSGARQQVKADTKLHFNLPKKDIASFFRYLLEEKIIVFDDNDERNNELQMKRFVDTHITYLNPSGQKVPMKNFNREYSEAKAYSNKEKYNSFINRFSAQLVDYRNSLKD
jgi:hypothetical protein